MASVTSLAALVHQRVSAALSAALPQADAADPMLRRSDRADFQANGLLALAKKLRGNPRELAAQVAQELPSGSEGAAHDVLANVEVSGPGFLNLTVSDRAIISNLAARASDDRLGVPRTDSPRTMIIEYSSPNVAKQMHVGHLRGTVIGDALVRIMEHRGERVVRRNHVGDWGTQFGMLVQYLIEHPHELDHGAEDGEVAEPPATGTAPTDSGSASPAGERTRQTGEAAIARLDRTYKAGRALFDSDPEFKERARQRLVDLQAGDPETLAHWQRFVDESKIYFNAVYRQLGVLLTDADIAGESSYNDELAPLAKELEESGVAVRSEGALVVFFDDVRSPEGKPVPLIVQKADGGFGYAATDLAAIRSRVRTWNPDTMLYLVDARQALHFKMVFETAQRAGWISEGVAHHLAFGTVLGPDGKPFKTRSGEAMRLVDLLNGAVERAAAVVAEKNPELTDQELDERARQVGVGAVKYADLSTSRTRDYVFDLDRMVSLNGDTGVYLQYAYARTQSILRKAGDRSPVAHPELPLAPAERALGLKLDELAETLENVAETYEPHRLAAYVYGLASSLTTFYDQCPVLKAEDPAVAENRLFLCDLTGRTLRQGMALLGMDTPERL